jgi:hypothetical protein
MSTPTEALSTIDRRNIAVRDEFAATERRLSAEMAAITLSARAKAEVEARFVYSERNPRDWDDVRVRVLADCERFEFAKAARYKIPNRGEGFTIRFVERTLALMGNLYCPSYVIYEDDERRTIRATVIDLERNVTWERDVTVQKTVERQDSTGREVVRIRQKADGGRIAIVRATDEELLSKEGSAISKAQRTNGQRLIPPGLLEEAKTAIEATLNKKVLDDPEAERKAIADAFASLGVLPSQLKDYLGCELAQIAPAELVGLREVFTAIREGHVTWRELVADRRTAQEQAGVAEPPMIDKSRTSALKDRLRKSSEVASSTSEAAAGSGAHDTQNGESIATSEAPAPQSGQGTSTRQTATDDKAGGTSTAPADSSGQIGHAGTAEASSKATDSPAPEIPAHIALLEGYRAKVGDKPFYLIMAKARRKYPDGFAIGHWRTEVPAEIAEEIIFDLEDEITAQREGRKGKKP